MTITALLQQLDQQQQLATPHKCKSVYLYIKDCVYGNRVFQEEFFNCDYKEVKDFRDLFIQKFRQELSSHKDQKINISDWLFSIGLYSLKALSNVQS